MQRIRRRPKIASIITLLPAIPTCFILSFAQAALYECSDSAGNVVMTDSPSQLIHCRIIFETPSTDTTAVQRSSAVPFIQSTNPSVDNETAFRGTDPDRSPDKSQSIIVPLQRIDSLFVVSVVVNSARVARLILDTGASHTVLSNKIAQDAGLLINARGTPVTLQTVGGQVRGDIVQVDSMKIDDAEVRSSLAAIYDLPDAPQGVEGLLGLSFLRHFQVRLDSTNNQLHLDRVVH